MKRTLVERVAFEMWNNATDTLWDSTPEFIRYRWMYEARRIIAIVRRHDSRKAGKR